MSEPIQWWAPNVDASLAEEVEWDAVEIAPGVTVQLDSTDMVVGVRVEAEWQVRGGRRDTTGREG